MKNRIAVPLLAVSLLAAPALAVESSPHASPVASPAKVLGSPRALVSPAKVASSPKPMTSPATIGSPHPAATPAQHTRRGTSDTRTAAQGHHGTRRHPHAVTATVKPAAPKHDVAKKTTASSRDAAGKPAGAHTPEPAATK